MPFHSLWAMLWWAWILASLSAGQRHAAGLSLCPALKKAMPLLLLVRLRLLLLLLLLLWLLPLLRLLLLRLLQRLLLLLLPQRLL